MNAYIEATSTLTDRYQTTVPETVRRVLQLGKRDKIKYVLLEDGSVLLTRAEDGDQDPVIAAFLSFLASDTQQDPGQIRSLPSALAERVAKLTAGVGINLDEPLDPSND